MSEPLKEAIAIEKEISDEEYMDILNESHGDVEICGMMFASGYALKQLDPIAFSTGANDYADSLQQEYACPICEENCGEDDEEAKFHCQEEPETE